MGVLMKMTYLSSRTLLQNKKINSFHKTMKIGSIGAIMLNTTKIMKLREMKDQTGHWWMINQQTEAQT